MNAHAPIRSSVHSPALAIDTLRVLPFLTRMQAYEDFDRAVSLWSLARLSRKCGGWDWRLDMRAALRAWKHYKTAVRMARGRVA